MKVVICQAHSQRLEGKTLSPTVCFPPFIHKLVVKPNVNSSSRGDPSSYRVSGRTHLEVFCMRRLVSCLESSHGVGTWNDLVPLAAMVEIAKRYEIEQLVAFLLVLALVVNSRQSLYHHIMLQTPFQKHVF
jgi:hypothetical protein